VLVPALNVPEERLDVPYPLFKPSLVRAVGREVEQADVVHAHGFLYLGSLAALNAARAAGVPTVLSEHVGHVPYESGLLDRVQGQAIARIGRWSVAEADAVLVHNEKVREQVLAMGTDTRVEDTANGVDLERFRPARAAEREELRAELGWNGRPRVLFVGRSSAKKGLDLALDAATAGDGAFELVVVGTDVEAPPGDVQVLGSVEPDRMPMLMRAADALLLPSRGEGFPMAVQEAMASGLPVVLGNDPVYRDHLEGAGGGARLVPLEADALARATTLIVGDPSAHAVAARDAYEHARRRFSFEHVVDDLERLYSALTVP
jgi:glycosyltransferase involved in cell wall biosynthesis